MNLAEAFRTTTFRWSLAIAGALLVQSAMLGGLFYMMTARHAIDEVDDALDADCQSVQGLDRAALIADIKRRVAKDVHRVNLAGLFDEAGKPVAGNIAHLPATLSATSGPVVVGLVRSEPPDPNPNASRSIVCPANDGMRAVFARDTDETDYISSLSYKALMGVTLPMLVMAGGLGLLLSARGQRRFVQVQTAIDDVMAGDLRRRLPIHSSRDPFDRLSVAVNAMLDRLEIAINDIRGMGDDLAHELRTPLTRLRARIERGCRDAETPADFKVVGERAIRDIDHALSIVTAILRIRAIEQSRRGSEFREVDLRTLLADAVDLYKPTAEERSVSIGLEATHAASVTADRDLLMEAVCNLIDNAIKFVPAGGHVTCLLDVHEGSDPVLAIIDDGGGIPAHEKAAVMRRFHRGSQQWQVDGHGIGLSLVAAIVDLHGFSLQIGDSEKGCRVSITCGPKTAASGRGRSM